MGCRHNVVVKLWIFITKMLSLGLLQSGAIRGLDTSVIQLCGKCDISSFHTKLSHSDRQGRETYVQLWIPEIAARPPQIHRADRCSSNLSSEWAGYPQHILLEGEQDINQPGVQTGVAITKFLLGHANEEQFRAAAFILQLQALTFYLFVFSSWSKIRILGHYYFFFLPVLMYLILFSVQRKGWLCWNISGLGFLAYSFVSAKGSCKMHHESFWGVLLIGKKSELLYRYSSSTGGGG